VGEDGTAEAPSRSHGRTHLAGWILLAFPSGRLTTKARAGHIFTSLHRLEAAPQELGQGDRSD
jgi:hypothetical protein